MIELVGMSYICGEVRGQVPYLRTSKIALSKKGVVDENINDCQYKFASNKQNLIPYVSFSLALQANQNSG